MSNTDGVIALAQAQQRLQQEKETFEQRKLQDASWFRIRCAIGWVVTVTLPSILVIAALIVGFHGSFSDTTVTVATSALLIDGAATVFSLYKIVLGNQGSAPLEPVTADAPPAGQPAVVDAPPVPDPVAR